MTVVGVDAALFAAVPYLDGTVSTARDQHISIGMKVNAFDAVFVTVEGADQFGRLQVPDFEGASSGAGTDEFFDMVELDALHRGGVATQAHETALFAHSPQIHLYRLLFYLFVTIK